MASAPLCSSPPPLLSPRPQLLHCSVCKRQLQLQNAHSLQRQIQLSSMWYPSGEQIALWNETNNVLHQLSPLNSPSLRSLARMVTDRLASPPQQITIISIAESPLVAEAASALGCHVLQLSPVEASGPWLACATLQALASSAAASEGALLVGYVFKHARALALEAQAMLPLLPADGVCFAPLDLSRCLEDQAACNLLLHKLTDALDPNEGSGRVPALNAAAHLFLEHAAAAASQQAGASDGGGASRPLPVLLDPWPAVAQVLDRVALARVLDRACLAARKAGVPVRTPVWTALDAFDAAASSAALATAGVRLPCIVKPRAACGVPEAHHMAFVLCAEGFGGLDVPLPAVAQEYVDHGGCVWKAYVAGGRVFSARRRSTPDLAPLARLLAADPDAGVPAAIDFDSLRSLPTLLPWTQRAQKAGGSGGGRGSDAAPVPELLQHPHTLEAVAAALRQELGLTLFGFDVVFDAPAGELVVIDLNYLPSYKDVPEAPAALRAALRAAAAERATAPANNASS